MKKILAKYIGIRFQDLIKKTHINKTTRFLLRSQNWTTTELQNYQFLKLKKLLEHAYANVPYYNYLFKKNSIHPNDIKTLTDYYGIPTLTKEIARNENSNLIASNINEYKIKKGKTGGTTGVPLNLYRDHLTRSFTWGAYYRWYNWMGIDVGDPVLVLWGSPEVLNNSIKNRIKKQYTTLFQNTLNINTFGLNENNISEVIKNIKHFKPKLIRGYLSAVLYLANYIEVNNIKGINPKAISTTSETLFPYYKKFIESVFHAPVFDQYGCGECNSIAFECSNHKGLHLCMEHAFVEILNKDNQQVFNESGRIIVTDLDNYAMPFIRYENGDIASMTTENCSCGVNLPLIEKIEGRTKDTIILKDGSRVHGVFFTDIFYELQINENIIKRFQVYQESPGAIELRLECSNKLDDQIILTKLKNNLNAFFNNVDIKQCNKLENDKSGKFRYIISTNEFI